MTTPDYELERSRSRRGRLTVRLSNYKPGEPDESSKGSPDEKQRRRLATEGRPCRRTSFKIQHLAFKIQNSKFPLRPATAFRIQNFLPPPPTKKQTRDELFHLKSCPQFSIPHSAFKIQNSKISPPALNSAFPILFVNVEGPCSVSAPFDALHRQQ
jgi:hypothetical protein